MSQWLTLLPSVAFARVSYYTTKAIPGWTPSLLTSTKLRTMLFHKAWKKEASPTPQLHRTWEVWSHAMWRGSIPQSLSQSWRIKTRDQRNNGISKFCQILPNSSLTPIWPFLSVFPVVGKDLYTATKQRQKNKHTSTEFIKLPFLLLDLPGFPVDLHLYKHLMIHFTSCFPDMGINTRKTAQLHPPFKQS